MKPNFEHPETVAAILKQIETVAANLWERGWAERNAGNISVLLPQGIYTDEQAEWKALPGVYPLLKNKGLYITGSGQRMQDTAASAFGCGLFIQICNKGEKYAEYKSNPDIKPSSEFETHLNIHQFIAERGSTEKVVMHTHTTELIALTQHPQIKTVEALNRILWSMHPETVMFIPKGVGFVPFCVPGSSEIATATLKAFEHHDIVVWEKHGVFAIGESPVQTFDCIDILSKSAKIWFMCKSAGFEPEGLSKAQHDALRLNHKI